MIRMTSLLLIVGGLTLVVAPTVSGAAASDAAIAEDVVLTQADVAQYDLSEERATKDVPPAGAACKKVRAVVRTANKQPQAASRFSSQPMIVEDRVVIYKSVKAAKSALAAYGSTQGARCLEADLDATLDVLLKAGTRTTYDRLSPDSTGLGDDSVLYQVPVDLSDADGNTGAFFAEVGLIRVGRGVATMEVLRFGNPFDGSVDLATILTDRLETGLA